MSAMSDYLEAGLLNYIFRNASAPSLDATNIWVSLHTADPTDVGNGAEVTTSGTNYARKAVARNVTTNWDAPASRATQNTNAITFNTPSGSWGTVSHFGIFDAATSGNLLFYGSLSQSKTIGGTDPAPSFAAGALDISFTGAYSTWLAHAIIDWIFRNASAPSLGTDVYFSLHTGDPGQTGATEVSAGGYGRVGKTRGTAQFGVGGADTAVTTGGAISNRTQIDFGTPSANWGTITDAGLWTLSSGGNFLFSYTMTDKTVNNGDSAPYIAANSITTTIA